MGDADCNPFSRIRREPSGCGDGGESHPAGSTPAVNQADRSPRVGAPAESCRTCEASTGLVRCCCTRQSAFFHPVAGMSPKCTVNWLPLPAPARRVSILTVDQPASADLRSECNGGAGTYRCHRPLPRVPETLLSAESPMRVLPDKLCTSEKPTQASLRQLTASHVS
jgi:hypothetical protein